MSMSFALLRPVSALGTHTWPWCNHVVKSALWIPVIASLALVGCAGVRPAPVTPGYHFGYRIRWFGSPQAEPVQVFDDGSDTYFELRPGSPAPVLFAVQSDTVAPVVSHQHGIYLVAPGVARGWRLVGPDGRGVVYQTGAPRQVPPEYLPVPATASVHARELPATLNGSIGRLIGQIQTLRTRITAEEAHRDVHARPTPDIRRYAVSIPFPAGVSTITNRRKIRILRLARLLVRAFVVKIRADDTPGGTIRANRMVADRRVASVISLLHAAGIHNRVFRVTPAGFHAAYPHVSIRFDLPVHHPIGDPHD